MKLLLPLLFLLISFLMLWLWLLLLLPVLLPQSLLVLLLSSSLVVQAQLQFYFSGGSLGEFLGFRIALLAALDLNLGKRAAALPQQVEKYNKGQPQP